MLSLGLPDSFISLPPVHNSSLLLKFNSITLCPFTPGSPKGLRAGLISVIWTPLSPSSCFLLIKELQPFLYLFSPSPASSSPSPCFITYSHSHHPFADSLNDELCSQFGVSRAGVQKPPGRVQEGLHLQSFTGSIVKHTLMWCLPLPTEHNFDLCSACDPWCSLKPLNSCYLIILHSGFVDTIFLI